MASSILSTPAYDVHLRLKTTGTAIKIAKKTTDSQDSTRNIIQWNIYRDNIHEDKY